MHNLEKLTHFNNLLFADLPKSIQLQFELRPVKIITLSDKSDKIVRFDLFQRLNTGGIALTPQEIRDCVFRGEFSNFLQKLAQDKNFNKIVFLTKSQQTDGTKEECILRFFAFLNEYKKFDHSVIDFLNDYMKNSSKSFDYEKGEKIFRDTFAKLAAALPNGIVRPHRKGSTSIILFEGVSVGAALAIQKKKKLDKSNINIWLGSQTLRKYTTSATNNQIAVRGRIEFCRDKFLGL